VVTLAAPFPFQDFIYQYGVRCEPLAGDPDELSQLFNDAGGNAYQMVRSMQKHVFRIAPEVVKGVRKALQGVDLLFHSFALTTGAHSLARELGIPDVSVQMFPVFAPTVVSRHWHASERHVMVQLLQSLVIHQGVLARR
jgi:hypothetical protein